jgi:hypothetical protein
VDYTRGFAHPGGFQLDRLNTQPLEQADPLAQQDRDQVDRDFVQQAQFQALPGDVRAAYTDVLLPCDLPGFIDRGFDC